MSIEVSITSPFVAVHADHTMRIRLVKNFMLFQNGKKVVAYTYQVYFSLATKVGLLSLTLDPVRRLRCRLSGTHLFSAPQ